MNRIWRLQDECKTCERLPITQKDFVNLISQLNQSTEIDAILNAFFCLVFAAFLQCGKFTYTAQERKTNDFDA